MLGLFCLIELSVKKGYDEISSFDRIPARPVTPAVVKERGNIMLNNRRNYLLVISILVILAASVLWVLVPTASAKHITANCYFGDPDDGEYVGNVHSPTPEDIAGVCNAVYAACKGKCTACYLDEGTEKICYDRRGRIIED